MADAEGGTGYQPRNISAPLDFSVPIMTLSPGRFLHVPDQITMVEEMGQALIPFLCQHTDGPPDRERWWRDKHWRVDYWNGGPKCKADGCLCCLQNQLGNLLGQTTCEQCRTAWVMSTVSRAWAKAVKTDPSGIKWWVS